MMNKNLLSTTVKLLLPAVVMSLFATIGMTSAHATMSSNTPPTPPILPIHLIQRGTIVDREEGTLLNKVVYMNGSSGESHTVRYNDHGSDRLIVSPSNGVLQILTTTNGKPSCYQKFENFPNHSTKKLPSLPFVREEVIDGLKYNVFIQSGPKYKLIFKFAQETVEDPETGGQARYYKAYNFLQTEEGVFIEANHLPASLFSTQENCVTDFLKETLPPSGVSEEDETHIDLLSLKSKSLAKFVTRDGMLQSLRGLPRYKRNTNELPVAVDNSRFAMQVRNQGMCGACWAFSSAAAMEIVYHKKHNMVVDGSVPFYGELWPLSPQYLVDCAGGNDHGHFLMHAKGCNSGYPTVAMNYVVKNGIPSEKDYSFRSVTGKQCKPVQNKTFPIAGVQQLVSWPNFTANAVEHVESIMDAVNQHGAVVVAIGLPVNFQYFSGQGIFSDPTCGPGLDHAVALVGYGHDDQANMDYWLVRNTFGAAWGDNGYFRIKRGANICGIEDFVFIPTAV